MNSFLDGQIENAWQQVEPRLSSRSLHPAIQWSYHSTLPFPEKWPLSPADKVVIYLFAQGFDFSGQLSDAVYVSTPWAVLIRPVNQFRATQLRSWSEEVALAGIQGVRPVLTSELNAGESNLTLDALLLASSGQPAQSRESEKAVRAIYRAFVQEQGILIRYIRSYHVDLFRWLEITQ